MANVNVDLAKLFRHIHTLSLFLHEGPESPKVQEYEFYTSVLTAYCKALKSQTPNVIFPVRFENCKEDMAHELAKSLGMELVAPEPGNTHIFFG